MQKLSSNGLGLHATHKIENQPSILENYNIYDSDKVLADCIQKSNAEWASGQLQKLGSVLGSSEFIEHGNLANNNKPIFHSHDRHGHRIDQVEYHPSYHQLFKLTVANGIHSDPWANPKSGAHAARAAKLFMTYQVDQGHICPTTMTYGCVPAISRQKEVADTWLPKIFSNEYDGSFRPIAEKSGATVGMAMTEKQGGSDVRSNTSTASPISTSGAGKDYLINGHKWFCSAPMSDAFLMLANTDGGPSCFLVPRWLPSGEKNNIFIQRLKNKLGDHSNASSEIELRDTFGTLIGDEGRGVSIIIEMASLTRVDCCLAAASLMRQGAVQALHYTSQRSAFGALLTEQPIMQKVLADLILESEASTRLAIRLASSY